MDILISSDNGDGATVADAPKIKTRSIVINGDVVDHVLTKYMIYRSYIPDLDYGFLGTGSSTLPRNLARTRSSGSKSVFVGDMTYRIDGTIRYARKNGGMVICIIESMSFGNKAAGVAVCSKEDAFSVKIGKTIAFRRAVEAMYERDVPVVSIPNGTREINSIVNSVVYHMITGKNRAMKLGK